jgi:hypothetical protein
MSRRVSDHDVFFDDETLRAMGKAYDDACVALGCSAMAKAREAVARRIVDVTRAGERNPARFYQEALKTHGAGEAGSSIAARAQLL